MPWYLRILTPFYSPDGAGGGDGSNDPNAGGEGGGNDSEPTGGNDPATDPTPEPGKTFTQEQLDEIISKRLARERKQWEQQIEEERKKAAMTEAERLKAEKEEAERKAQDAQTAANQRIINAEAKVLAVSLGVKPERVAYALKLADLSAVEVDENGDPDADAIKAAIEAVINDLPELKGTQGPSRSGSEFNGGNKTDKNPWLKEHFNLTEQGRIMRENPDLAARLKQEAKGK